MEQPTIATKITAFVKENLLDKQKTFIEQLAKGGLYAFEENLTEVLQSFYNLISEELLVAAAQAAEPVLRVIAKRKRLGKLVKRPMSVQLKTGHYVSVEGLYAKTAPAQHVGSRHLLTGLGGGSYSVTVTDAVGCTGDVQFSMTAPDTLVAEATGTDVLCAGQSTGTATATATGGTPIAIGAYSYHWSNAMTTPAIGPLPSGTYAVTVSDGNGCSDTASVFIASPPSLNLTVEATAVLCFGEHDGTAAAFASGGTPIAIGAYTFLWNNGLTDSLLTGLPPGSYAVTVTDGHDCTQVAQAQIDSSTQQRLCLK